MTKTVRNAFAWTGVVLIVALAGGCNRGPDLVRAGQVSLQKTGAPGVRVMWAEVRQEGPTAVVTGSLVTRIRFRGDPIVRERTEAYEIKPGRWVVDAEVTLPSAAEAGVYAYEIEFSGGDLHFSKSLTFVVRR